MTPTPLPVSAPPRIRQSLRDAPDGPVRVVHRGPHAVYVELGGWCVGLVDSVATQVPCALRSAGVGVPEARTAQVVAGVLHLDGTPLAVGRLVDVRVPRIPVPPHTTPATLPAAEVAALVGAGDGLTPYGDDVLCGWLAAHRAAGIATPAVDRAVRGLLHRTTLLSATLLEAALHAEVLPELGAWLAAVDTPEERDRTARLHAVGGSSGTGLHAGARRALSGLREARHGIEAA